MPITTMIVDDEPLARRGVELRLRETIDFHLIGQCVDGLEAVKAIPNLAPDLIFLDVHMPEMNGIEVLAALKPLRLQSAVIFLTAYDEYALSAFEVHALDYLLKPIDDDRFQEALERARQSVLLKKLSMSGSAIEELLKARDEDEGQRFLNCFRVREGHRVIVLRLEDVDWIGATDGYAAIYVGKKVHLLRQSLSTISSRLDPKTFLRVHRSAIVRLDRLVSMQAKTNGDLEATLIDGTCINVSRTYSSRLRNALR